MDGWLVVWWILGRRILGGRRYVLYCRWGGGCFFDTVLKGGGGMRK